MVSANCAREEKQEPQETHRPHKDDVETTIVLAGMGSNQEAAAHPPPVGDRQRGDLALVSPVLPAHGYRVTAEPAQAAEKSQDVHCRPPDSLDEVALRVDRRLEAQTHAVVEATFCPPSSTANSASRQPSRCEITWTGVTTAIVSSRS